MQILHTTAKQQEINLQAVLYLVPHLKIGFADIRSLEDDNKLFNSLFNVQVDKVQKTYQMEVVELQCSNELISKLQARGISLLDVYKKNLYCKQYPKLD